MLEPGLDLLFYLKELQACWYLGWVDSWTTDVFRKVMERALPFVFLSGHAGAPDLHCSESVPAPGEDRPNCAHCHHLERWPDVACPSPRTCPHHLTEEHRQKQYIRLGLLGLGLDFLLPT